MKLRIDRSFVDPVKRKSYWKGQIVSVDNQDGKRLLNIKINGAYVATEVQEHAPIRQKGALEIKEVVANTIIYMENLYKVGGTETWLYNMLKILNRKDDIVLVYSNNQGHLLEKISDYCYVLQDRENYMYTCNVFIVATVSDEKIFRRVKKSKSYQFVHADIKTMNDVNLLGFIRVRLLMS